MAVTISLIGKNTYSTLKDLYLPDLPFDKSYQEMTTLVKGFYKPKVLEVAETYRFHQTVQKENESVNEYANKLKRLAVHCNFGQNFQRALRVRKKKLLSEDRTFEQTLKVAQANELAEKESKQLLQYTKRERDQCMEYTEKMHKARTMQSQLFQNHQEKIKRVSDVNQLNIWLTSAVILKLLVIIAKEMDTWLRCVSRETCR